MGFIRILFIFIITILSITYGVVGQNNKSDTSSVPATAANTKPVPFASYVIQQVTHSYHFVANIFYYFRKNEIIFINSKINGSVFSWNATNGVISRFYFKELSKEVITIVTPDKTNADKYIVGTDHNLRLFTESTAGNNLSEPIIHFNETDYNIYTAHCDSNGRMFILLHSKNRNGTSKLYKLENKKTTLVQEYSNKVYGYRFNNANNLLYMIHNHGKKILEYKYNLNTGVIGASTVVFDIHNYTHLSNNTMKSVVLDRNGNLWVASAGKEGIVLNVNPKNGKLLTDIIVPIKDLTYITFGTKEYGSIFVGSKRTCAKGYGQGSIYAISGMGVKGVADKPIKW